MHNLKTSAVCTACAVGGGVVIVSDATCRSAGIAGSGISDSYVLLHPGRSTGGRHHHGCHRHDQL